MERKPISLLENLPKIGARDISDDLRLALAKQNRKIVVLDDDPTGVQTVHGVSVYTGWDYADVLSGFKEDNSMFFILTNSRAFPSEVTALVHAEIARAICQASEETGKDYILISRSDSTLRGHFPLETEALRQSIEVHSSKRFDGEILCPFFQEGGRFTIGDVHYVREGEFLVPAGETEFAKDKTFGFESSHLGRYIEEKTNHKHTSESCIYISLEDLRDLNISRITEQLTQARDFQKIVVNAADYFDLKVFAIAFIDALAKGKEFMFRSAAAVPKVLGAIANQPLLTKGQLIRGDNENGGIILVGSHVNRTSAQLEVLRNSDVAIEFIEFNQHLVMVASGLESEVERTVALADRAIAEGKSVVIHTRRDRFDLPDNDKDAQLEVSVRISDALTSTIAKLTVQPSFIIAKGGITSSDVGTKALGVKRAVVMGQIMAGIPVWMTGPESKFPNMPYIIFPGNVGSEQALMEVAALLTDKL